MRFRPTSTAPQSPAHDPLDLLGGGDAVPASPPPEVLAEVDAAWRRAAELAASNRELHFSLDHESGRVSIEVRTLAGAVIETITPSRCLAVMAGEAL
jgi:hypothetical protein